MGSIRSLPSVGFGIWVEGISGDIFVFCIAATSVLNHWRAHFALQSGCQLTGSLGRSPWSSVLPLALCAPLCYPASACGSALSEAQSACEQFLSVLLPPPPTHPTHSCKYSGTGVHWRDSLSSPTLPSAFSKHYTPANSGKVSHSSPLCPQISM